MNKKILIIFLAAFALGGAASYYLLSQLTQGGGEDAMQAAKPKRPDWMAPPGSEGPLGSTAKRPDWMAPEGSERPLSDQPKSVTKQEPAERQRIMKVGVIGPETGEGAVFGLSVVNGVQLAAERFNAAGGIGGKGFEVLHYDNKGGDAQTREIFSDLARQGVMAIFSAPTGWSTFAPVHLANSTKTIMISVGARRNIGRSGDYVFQFSLPDDVAINDLLSFSVKQLGYKDYALVTSSANDYSLDISAHFKRAISKQGGTIRLDADTYDTFTGSQNIAAVVEALRSASTPLQAMIFTGDADEAAKLVKAVAAAGLKLPLVGGEDLFTDEFLKKGGAAARGTLLYTTFAPDGKTPQMAEFLGLNAKSQGGVPNRFTALAYDAFTNLAGAAKDSGTLGSSKVRAVMLGGKGVDGVTGATSWTSEGVAIKHPFIYRIAAEGDRQKFVLLQ